LRLWSKITTFGRYQYLIIMANHSVPNKDFFNFEFYPVKNSAQQLKSVLGSNQKSLLLIGTEISRPEDIDFLSKVLKAIQYDYPNDIALLDIAATGTLNLTEVFQQLEPKEIILFGESPMKHGLHIKVPYYEWFKWQDWHILRVESLTTLQTQVQKKKAFWGCLKSHFLDK